jgi:hypothetical protein
VSTHRESIKNKLLSGAYEEYNSLSICRINDFYTIHSGVKYQVHNDTHRHSFSVLYDDLEEAIDQFFEIRRKMR